MPSQTSAKRLTHDQIVSITLPGAGKERECPVCLHLHLQLFGTDDFACQGPDHCDPSEIAAALWAKLDRRVHAKQKAPHAPSGLTVEEYAAAKKLPADWLRTFWGLSDTQYHSTPAVKFPYLWLAEDADTTIRGGEKNVKYRLGMGHNDHRKSAGSKADLYGQAQMHLRIRSDNDGQPFDTCFIVEGESDTQTMMWNGFPTLGVSGAPTWKKEWAQNPFLDGKSILVIQEPDDASAKWVQNIAKTFPPGTVRAVRLPEDKDASELWLRMWTSFGELDEELALENFQTEICKAVEASTIVAASGEESVQPDREISTVLASAVTMKLTKWLWTDHVPLHHVTVFAGMPQKGKSTAAVDVVARLTTGADFPGAPNTIEPCEVIVLASEDDFDTTIVPRLTAAGADLNKVHFATHSFIPGKPGSEAEVMLDSDLHTLGILLRKHPTVKLVLVDPVTSYIGEVDPNKPKEVRPFLNKLKAFAKEMDITVLLIMHMSKNPDVSALHRVGGAATWIEVPRSVWFFDLKHVEDEDARPLTYVMVNGKLNLVADDRKKTLEYQFTSVDVEIEGQNESIGRIKWGAESDLTLEQQFKPRDRQKPGPEAKKTEEVMNWLAGLLADGERYASEIILAGSALGYGEDLIRTAKKRLGVGNRRGDSNMSLWLIKKPSDLGDD